MDDKYTKVNIESIKDVDKEFSNHNKNIINKLVKIMDEINNMDEFFYTNTSIEYKNRLTKYLNKTIDSFNDNQLYFDRQFKNIVGKYTEFNNDLTTSVNGNNTNTEVIND